MGSDQRLLDLNGEYDMTDRQMYAGLELPSLYLVVSLVIVEIGLT